MKINKSLDEIIETAVQQSAGNPWRAYEYAKHEVMVSLDGETPRSSDLALRQIADALGI